MIKVENVWFSYDGVRYVLKDVIMKFSEGNYIAIMGENGSGKTTLLKHLNGLLKPNKGRVLVDGIETSKIPVSELARKVAIVFQNPEMMFFSERVYDEISFALRNFGLDEEIIEKTVKKVLNIFGLDEYATESPFNLSEGEKRRLAFACVLAWNPKYIVLDEPTAGQDVFQRELLRGLIKQLTSQGRTVIIASHDVEFVAETKPYIYLLSKGEVIGEGKAEDVLTDDKLIKKAGLIKPQIVEVFNYLGFNYREILDVNDALDFIIKKVSERNV